MNIVLASKIWKGEKVTKSNHNHVFNGFIIMVKQFCFQSHNVMFCICPLTSVNVHSSQETGDVARHLQDLRVVEFLKILHFPEVV